VVGIEPTTYGLRNRCSATELHWRFWRAKGIGAFSTRASHFSKMPDPKLRPWFGPTRKARNRF
jgi:hypothetical protein